MKIYTCVYSVYILTLYTFASGCVVLHMGWLQLVGLIKFKVFFAKEPYKRDDILQKRPRILRSLLIVAPHSVVCIFNRVVSCVYFYTLHTAGRDTAQVQKMFRTCISQDTLQHTATHCNTLQHTATHCNTLQHTATNSDTLRHTATHCDTL